MLESFFVQVGHALDNDFRALNLHHGRVIDTSVLYPHPKGAPYKSSLKALARSFLGKTIQQCTHDSTEDAVTAMQLALLKIEGGAGSELASAVRQSESAMRDQGMSAVDPSSSDVFGRRNEAAQVAAVLHELVRERAAQGCALSCALLKEAAHQTAVGDVAEVLPQPCQPVVPVLSTSVIARTPEKGHATLKPRRIPKAGQTTQGSTGTKRHS